MLRQFTLLLNQKSFVLQMRSRIRSVEAHAAVVCTPLESKVLRAADVSFRRDSFEIRGTCTHGHTGVRELARWYGGINMALPVRGTAPATRHSAQGHAATLAHMISCALLPNVEPEGLRSI